MLRESEPDLPDELHRLLIDPTVRDVERALRDVSSTGSNIGLDLFFAGHGEEETGNLVLKDGTLSPTRLLELHGGQGSIGVWLDSCYSGAFLLRLAIEGWPWLVDGFASCLPDEVCFEMDTLGHGVFTYTRLHPGNAHVDKERFNQAILANDPDELAKSLQGLVGMTSSPSAFLTEGAQFSMTLYKHDVEVDGGFALVELGEMNDLADITRRLTRFKKAGVPYYSSAAAASSRRSPPTS